MTDPILCRFSEADQYGIPMSKSARWAAIAAGTHPQPLTINSRAMFRVADLRQHAEQTIEEASAKAESDREKRSARARAVRRGNPINHQVAA
jgi:hypothetical protein